MSHRAAIYLLCVHPSGRPDDHRLLGDFDDQGTSLLDVLKNILPDVRYENDNRKLRYQSSRIEGDDLMVMFEHCQTGIDAQIRNEIGETRYHQLVKDSQDVEVGSLFRLHPNDRTGYVAIHIPDRRGIKSMLFAALSVRFRAQFDGLVLTMTPFVMESTLRKAIDEDRIQTVTLVRRVQPSDRADLGIAQWVHSNTIGKIKLTIGANVGGKAMSLITEPLRRFLANEPGAREAIVEFKDMTFDEAKVEIRQTTGTRTFNIEHPESGHPLTETIDLPRNEKPTDDAIFAGLAEALRTVRE